MVVPRESWSCDMKANAILKRIPLQKREMTLLFIRPCCIGSTLDYSTMCMYLSFLHVYLLLFYWLSIKLVYLALFYCILPKLLWLICVCVTLAVCDSFCFVSLHTVAKVCTHLQPYNVCNFCCWLPIFNFVNIQFQYWLITELLWKLSFCTEII